MKTVAEPATSRLTLTDWEVDAWAPGKPEARKLKP